MSNLLIGCWYVPVKPNEVDYDVCFRKGGTAETSVFLPLSREGFGETGTYRIASGKLVLHMDYQSDGWFFPYLNTACDLVIKPGKALLISNCTGRPRDEVGNAPTMPMVFHRSHWKPSKASGL